MDYMNALRHMGGSLVYELSLHPKPNIEEIIYSEEFIQTRGAQQRPDCLVHKARITEADALLVRETTMGQRDNPAWHLASKGCLTAGNFGSVLHAKCMTPSLLKQLFGEYGSSRVKAVQWGVSNEAEAVRAFTSLTGETVQETGMWLEFLVPPQMGLWMNTLFWRPSALIWKGK